MWQQRRVWVSTRPAHVLLYCLQTRIHAIRKTYYSLAKNPPGLPLLLLLLLLLLLQRCLATRPCWWTRTPCAWPAHCLGAQSWPSTTWCMWSDWTAVKAKTTRSSRCEHQARMGFTCLRVQRSCLQPGQPACAVCSRWEASTAQPAEGLQQPCAQHQPFQHVGAGKTCRIERMQ